MEVHLLFAKSIVFKKIMKIADYSITAFGCAVSFVNQEVNLLWNVLTANAEKADFPWTQKIHGTWLHWVMWKMDLLCEVETVVIGCCVTADRMRAQSW